MKLDVPNVSSRMDNLRAAILRPQIGMLEDRRARWRVLYQGMEAGLAGVPGLRLIPRPQVEDYVGSSFQFLLPDWSAARIGAFLGRTLARGVELKWFGAADPVAFTSRYQHSGYAEPQSLPQTDAILAGLVDMRVPLTFTVADCVQIARISQPMLGQLGIAKGDVVLEVGRTPVASVAAFEKAVSAFKSGDRVRVLIRNAESTAIHLIGVP